MDAKHPQDEDTTAAGRETAGVVVSRRRFTRAGLSGSVVLGSLASKPVLGAVPYHCTVSGQVSGNLSRAAVAGECMLGRPPSYWKTAQWPLIVTSQVPGLSWYLRGTLPNSQNCNFTGNESPTVPRVRGTNFNGFTPGGGVPQLIGAFYNSSGGGSSCTVGTSPTLDPSTMLQVLYTDSTNPDDQQFVLGRVVVASLLNARSLGNTYPVTEHTIIAMFNATFGGGSYQVVVGSVTVPWSRDRVIEYLSSLFKAS